ncbi:MAG: ABC transporter permease [Myxococcota bacterium]|nr:ABC transporter permease [Myxococcota bacterium]
MSDDPAQEPSVAIDLSRRKDAAVGGVVRASMAGAGRVARPYVTMTRIALARLARSPLARAGAVLLACLALVGIFADLLASDLPVVCRFHEVVYFLPNVTHPAALADTDCARMRRAQHRGDWLLEPLVAHGPAERAATANALRAPWSGGHPLGTDAFGRDVFARVVHGARTTLSLGVGASLVLVAIGVALGALAGFAGGLADALVSRAVESLTAVPTLVLALVVSAIVPHPTTATLLWVIALTRWTELARLVRAEVLLALSADYVIAARALGSSPWRVLSRHVMPNAIGPAIVAAAFGVASVVLVEASLDFLRAGSADTIASWGESMGEARAHTEAWWLVVFPGAALLATLVALNLVGEAARDALDPRLRGVGEELTEAMRG